MPVALRDEKEFLNRKKMRNHIESQKLGRLSDFPP
jgi:hypothetical protein